MNTVNTALCSGLLHAERDHAAFLVAALLVIALQHRFPQCYVATVFSPCDSSLVVVGLNKPLAVTFSPSWLYVSRSLLTQWSATVPSTSHPPLGSGCFASASPRSQSKLESSVPFTALSKLARSRGQSARHRHDCLAVGLFLGKLCQLWRCLLTTTDLLVKLRQHWHEREIIFHDSPSRELSPRGICRTSTPPWERIPRFSFCHANLH